MIALETIPNHIRERLLLAAAAIFLIVGGVTLTLASSHPPGRLILALVVWVLSFAAIHIYLDNAIPQRDPLLLPTVALLTGWGLLLIGRLTPPFLTRQTIWLIVAAGTLVGVVRFSHDMRWLRRFRYTWLLGGLALLAATLIFGVNPSGYGPRLWLGGWGVYCQPAELLKLLMIAFLASYLAERKGLIVKGSHKIGRWRLPPLAYVGPMVAMFGLTVLLLAWQQDLGAAMLFFFTFLVMLYLATRQWEYAAAGLALFAIAGAVGYRLSDKVALRIDGWLNPWPEASDRAFQIVQSLLAFGAGGVFGQGLGLGRPTYIPAVHTDFVFAALAEEFGLAGVLVIIGLYGLLLLRGLRAAARAPHPFNRFLAAGLAAGLVIQAWVIMAGNAKLAPIAGVTLPFVSYGGSSIVTSFIALGFLLRISSQQPARDTVEKVDLPLLRLSYPLSAALILLAATCGYWSIAQARSLRAREDNPRRVLYEQRIARGRIMDRDGAVLASSLIGEDGRATRRYPIPEAAPTVGYASLRHGTGGIESAFDAELRGEAGRSAWEAAWDDLLHRPPQGSDVQLTIDIALQKQAQRALEGHQGAIVLLDAANGHVLAMASSPTFNPAELDETWDELRQDPAAPLVNRATQGLYQPGTTLQTIVLAEALERGLVTLDQPAINALDTVSVDGVQLGCSRPPQPADEPYTLANAYAAACPTPFAALGPRLGSNGLVQAIDQWSLAYTAPPLEMPTEAADWEEPARLRDAAIGQGNLTVSPLQMALVAGTIANDGTMPAPRMALRIEGDQHWQGTNAVGKPHLVISESRANDLRAAWSEFGESGTRGHLGMAVAGQNQRPHAWFLGIRRTGASRYAVAVLLEHPDQVDQAATVGVSLLEAATD